MEHTEAVRLHAAEKYLLGELTGAQRQEYEEHYFDCAACAEELKATVTFLESAKQVAREEAAEPADSKQFVPAKGGWLAWLRPAFAVPVFAALLLFIGYQNGITIPNLRDSSSRTAQISSAPFHLKGEVRGGSDEGRAAQPLRVHSGETFLLNFDFTPARTFSTYQWQLQDQAGRVVSQGTASGDKTNQTVYLAMNGGVKQAGKYSLVFFGAGDEKPYDREEVQRLTFSVEILQ